MLSKRRIITLFAFAVVFYASIDHDVEVPIGCKGAAICVWRIVGVE